MRKVYLPLSFILLLFSFLLLPVVKAGSHTGHAETLTSNESNTAKASTVEYYSNLLYDSLHLEEMGLKKDALTYAYRGQQHLAKQGKLSNTNILTVCDFSQPS